MSDEQTDRRGVRLFTAVDVPDQVRDGIRLWGETALADPALRPIVPESLHVTLVFLGSRHESDIEPLGRILSSMPRRSVSMQLRPAAVPVIGRDGRPALYALEVVSPGLAAMREELRVRLVDQGFHRRESRVYWPHLTVARVRARPGSRGRRMAVETPPAELPASLQNRFPGVRLTLYLSKTMPQGARYVPLVQLDLPIPGQRRGDAT